MDEEAQAVRAQVALNALEPRAYLRRSPVPVPPPGLTAYPELRAIATPASEANAC